MVRMGPRQGPRQGPTLGPNPAAGDPLAGYVSTFTTDFNDSFLFLAVPLPAEATTGSGPFRMTTDGVLPSGLFEGTDYYAGTGGVDTWTVSADPSGFPGINFTDDGTGTHTLTYVG